MNYTYILRCSDGTYYTGWTTDLKKRLKAHNGKIASKYTRGRTPVNLTYYEEFETKKEAMKREVQIKKLTRKQKELLIAKFSLNKGGMV
ncbi:GIY-YIG nuclease family protein [Clostridiaceae bacterium M8S5]|nr:GIY-YIG nuclease family protein [Clostridiaceae bacterium M8S5]